MSFSGGVFDLDAKRKRVEELNQITSRPDFWNDGEKAQGILKEQAGLKDILESWERYRAGLEEARFFLDLAKDEKSDEALSEAATKVAEVAEGVAGIELSQTLGGPDDRRNAIVSLHPGAGGTEAQDWAEMLLRMEMRWAERRGFKIELKEATAGGEAGITSATFLVHGDNAYGLFGAERGVHRLVRQSPFDSAHRRHTSFALVEVAPLVDDDIEIEIDDADLQIDTYRASGAGGQHVNKTDSAVRITHKPTGIVVQCQDERSQGANKHTAMKMLRARIVALEEAKRAEELAAEKGEAIDVNFGSQIRSYVMHPYSMVKDHRTNFEVGDVQRVLDGDLDGFVHAELSRRAVGRPSERAGSERAGATTADGE